MWIGISIIVSFLVGLGCGLALLWLRQRDASNLAAELKASQDREIESLRTQLKESFSSLSLEALSKNTEEFLKIAQDKFKVQTGVNEEALTAKKSLIDQTLQNMKGELDKVQITIQNLEKDRQTKFSQLSEQMKHAAEETKQLRETAGGLKAMLADNRVRGQWGERMAEDVLQLAGFVQGINYQKQRQVSGDGSGVPDYTFYMPQGRVVHMDVKFPLNNYSAALNAEDAPSRDKYQQQFLRDVKQRIKEVTNRGYIDKDTLDYVLVFIPNEQIYSFINEHAPQLLDEAMSQKVILCSPMTLYAILAVMRQAVENFNLSQTTGEIMDQVSNFKTQWEKFTETLERLGKQVTTVQNTYEDLIGTRRRALEKPLNKIGQLQSTGRQVTGPTGQQFTVLESVPKEASDQNS